MGKLGKCVAYTADKERPGKAKRLEFNAGPGPFRQAGLLVVRSAWELCCQASHEEKSVYSTVDCVVTNKETPPAAWVSVGFPWSVKATGPAVICGRGCWRVGHRATKGYRAGWRYTCEAERQQMPAIVYYRNWL